MPKLYIAFRANGVVRDIATESLEGYLPAPAKAASPLALLAIWALCQIAAWIASLGGVQGIDLGPRRFCIATRSGQQGAAETIDARWRGVDLAPSVADHHPRMVLRRFNATPPLDCAAWARAARSCFITIP